MINIINLIIVIVCWMIYYIFKNKFNYLMDIVGFIGGFFLGQTIVWLVGNQTIIDKILIYI